MKGQVLIGLVVGLLVLGAVGVAAAGEFVSLFDGKSLEGWHAAPGGNWEVKHGVIVGTSAKTERRHGILLSDKKYGDFVLRLKFKSIKGNSGLYFRAQRVDRPVTVHGFQAEIAPSGPVGGLYETGGRAWVAKPDAELVNGCFKPGDWNEMTVTADGRDISVKLNGVTTAELKNDPGRLEGYFGLQLHGGTDMHVAFKDIEIQVDPKR